MEKTTYDDEKRIAHLSGGQTIYAVHKSTECYGDVCPLHDPSAHDLADYPLTYDPMIGSFFRVVGDEEVIDPDDYNLNRFGEVIIRNAALCLLCNVEIESTHRHDFRTCRCGAVSVDGGHAYIRRLANAGTFEDKSIIARKDI